MPVSPEQQQNSHDMCRSGCDNFRMSGSCGDKNVFTGLNSDEAQELRDKLAATGSCRFASHMGTGGTLIWDGESKEWKFKPDGQGMIDRNRTISFHDSGTLYIRKHKNSHH